MSGVLPTPSTSHNSSASMIRPIQKKKRPARKSIGVSRKRNAEYITARRAHQLVTGGSLASTLSMDCREAALPFFDKNNDEIYKPGKRKEVGFAIVASPNEDGRLRGGAVLLPTEEGSHVAHESIHGANSYAWKECSVHEGLQYNTDRCEEGKDIGKRRLSVHDVASHSVYPFGKRPTQFSNGSITQDPPQGGAVEDQQVRDQQVQDQQDQDQQGQEGRIDYVMKSQIEDVPRICRTFIDHEGKVHTENTHCGVCEGRLDTELQMRTYMYCRTCKDCFHIQCLRVAAKDQRGDLVKLPLQLVGESVLDREGRQLNCSHCSFDNQGRQQPLVPHFLEEEEDIKTWDLIFAIDIGSQLPKISLALRDGTDKRRLVFKHPQAYLPVSGVFVDAEDELSTQPAEAEVDTENYFAIMPIKRALFDESVQTQLKRRKISIKDVFFKFFVDTLDAVYASQTHQLDEFVTQFKQVSRNSGVFNLRLLVALPSGMHEQRQNHVLSALDEAGQWFLEEKLRLSGRVSRRLPAVLPESEMALVEFLRRMEREERIRKRFNAVFDFGGTTLDASLHERYIDGLFELHKCHFADNTRHGSVNHVFKILEAYPMLRKAWHRMYRWVIKALPLKDLKKMEAAFVPRDPVREEELRAWFLSLKKQSEDEVNAWLNSTCDTIVETLTKEGCDGRDLSVLLTGGGLVDKKVYDRFTKTIMARVPNVTIVDNRSSETKNSAVLQGLQEFAQTLINISDNATRAPITVLQGTNLTSEKSTHVILVNKGDPGHHKVLLPFYQPRPGEFMEIDIKWFMNSAAVIPFYAQHERVEDAVIENRLYSTPSWSTKELYRIGTVLIKRPRHTPTPTKAYLATWVDPSGRTLRSKFFVFDKELSERMDVNRTDIKVLEALAIDSAENIWTLDTFSVQYRQEHRTTPTPPATAGASPQGPITDDKDEDEDMDADGEDDDGQANDGQDDDAAMLEEEEEDSQGEQTGSGAQQDPVAGGSSHRDMSLSAILSSSSDPARGRPSSKRQVELRWLEEERIRLEKERKEKGRKEQQEREVQQLQAAIRGRF